VTVAEAALWRRRRGDDIVGVAADEGHRHREDALALRTVEGAETGLGRTADGPGDLKLKAALTAAKVVEGHVLRFALDSAQGFPSRIAPKCNRMRLQLPGI
jgi:hypothetical protein